ncbi:MAG: hypothetical protein GX682_02500 [Clostridiaceae bacterium]|nr:hypothetical protein [Clostridiaceae bacterium]
MKKIKRNNVLIILVVLLLALAVGYAAFQQVLTVTGTASAAGTWEVKFIDPTTITTGHGTATITADDAVTVNATLGFPGDGCQVTVHITNTGSIPAKLTKLELLNATGLAAFADDDITITTPAIQGETLAAGETCEFTFAIAWNEDSTATTKDVGFQIKFTYDQNTTPVTVDTEHPTHTNS